MPEKFRENQSPKVKSIQHPFQDRFGEKVFASKRKRGAGGITGKKEVSGWNRRKRGKGVLMVSAVVY